MTKSSKADPLEVLKRLERVFTEPGAMDLGDAYKTIVGVLLSARTRDEQVLLALPGFFRAFPTVQDLAQGSVADIRHTIATIGMNGQKAKHLKAMAQRICKEFDGKVPKEMDDLVSLAGVGRKTASVVQSVAFNTPAIAVDVHVHRLASRLGWSKAKLPQGTEKDLLALIPPASHSVVNRVFVKLGRYICLPSKPRCAICPLQDICPYGAKNLSLSKSESELWDEIKRKEDYLQALRAPLTKVK